MTDPRSEARARVQRYIDMRRKQPCRQLGDSIHGIHFGTEWRAELRFSDLEAAFAEPAAAMPGLSPDQCKWLCAAAGFMDHCAGIELDFEDEPHGALAIVEGLHEAFFDDQDSQMDRPFHEAVAIALADAILNLTPSHSGETGSSFAKAALKTSPDDGGLS